MDGPARINCWTPLVYSATILILLLLNSACTAPRYESTTAEGKAAILDQTNLALTREDCAAAVTAIEGLYASTYTDNEVRIARASAQGCAGGISNFTQLILDIADNASQLEGAGFWTLMSKLFYHASDSVLDTRIEALSNSTDSLFAALSPGTVVASVNRINADTTNVGSLIADDRIDDANLYLFFVSMGLIGSYQNRYGEPDSTTFARTQILGATTDNPDGWTRHDKVDEAACAYGSAVVNMLDAIDVMSTRLDGQVGENMAKISTYFGALIDQACDYACRGEAVGIPGFEYDQVGCGDHSAGTPSFDFSSDHLCQGTSKRPCLLALRDRNICTANPTSVTALRAQCAAAGIAHLVSKTLAGWQQ